MERDEFSPVPNWNGEFRLKKENSRALDENMVWDLIQNRDELFGRAGKRIEQREEKERLEELEKKRIEEEKQEKIRANTVTVANAMVSLIYNILNNADKKKDHLNCDEISEVLGKPYNQAICGLEASNYSFDDDGLTVFLNYSREGYDRSVVGGTSFINNWDSDKTIDEEYLKELLEECGIEYLRSRTTFTEDTIDTITIKLKRYMKKYNRG